MDACRTHDLVFIAFDLLYLDGKSMAALPLIERKERLRTLFACPILGLRFSDHVVRKDPQSHDLLWRPQQVRARAISLGVWLRLRGFRNQRSDQSQQLPLLRPLAGLAEKGSDLDI